MTAETIVAAACCYQELIYSVPAPGRHHNILFLLPAPERHLCEQGFLTSTGRFVPRIPARDIAYMAGQLTKESLHSRELFSEDLW